MFNEISLQVSYGFFVWDSHHIFFPFVFYAGSMVLSGHVCIGKIVVCVLDVFHLWPIHWQFHYLMCLHGLLPYILLVVVFDIGAMLKFPKNNNL